VTALFRERWLRSAYLSGITLFLSVVIADPARHLPGHPAEHRRDGVLTTGHS